MSVFARSNYAEPPPKEALDPNYVAAANTTLRALQYAIHRQNAACGWWHETETGAAKFRNVAELLCLVHSEVSEAMEGARKDLQDTHLPERKMIEVELADVIVRVLDLAEALDLDVAGALFEKLAYNLNRADHDPAVRAQANGKAF